MRIESSGECEASTKFLSLISEDKGVKSAIVFPDKLLPGRDRCIPRENQVGARRRGLVLSKTLSADGYIPG